MSQKNLVYIHLILTIIALLVVLSSIFMLVQEFNSREIWSFVLRSLVYLLMLICLRQFFVRKRIGIILFVLLFVIDKLIMFKTYYLSKLLSFEGLVLPFCFLFGGIWVINQMESYDIQTTADDAVQDEKKHIIDKIKSIFYEEDEEYVSAIGQGYLTSILQGNLSNSVLILSTKRLYQKGKIFEKQQNNRFTSTKGSKVIDVTNISGISYSETNESFYLVLGILLLPFGIGLFLIAYYFYLRRRYLVVEYAGGAIATDAKWYTASELDEFQKNISILKSKK